MTTDAMNGMLVDAARDGKGHEIAQGLIAMHAMAAVLFLRGQVGDGPIDQKHQEEANFDARIALTRCREWGRMAAAKALPSGTPKDTVDSLAEAIASATIAHVVLHLTARACGAKPVVAAGMAGMGTEATLKDIPGLGAAAVAEAAGQTPPVAQQAGVDMAAEALYVTACAIGAKEREISVSALQRRMGLGYTEASRLVDRMRTEGRLGGPVLDANGRPTPKHIYVWSGGGL